jgi:hypothetical protein
MGMKFLNKKGWHTGSLRNIERVWVAEEKEKEEQRKIQELKKQQDEEREKAAFRKLQEDAGLKPRQERLDFLYESGLAVGKGSSEGFQALQPSAPAAAAAASSSAQASAGSSKVSRPFLLGHVIVLMLVCSSKIFFLVVHLIPLILSKKFV